MRRSLPLLPCVVLVGALALGCAEQQSPTASPGDSSPSFSATRSTTPFGFFFVDEERGLTTMLGNTFAELPGACAGTDGPEEANFLEVDKPTGAVKILLRNQEVSVVVWQLVSFDLCGELATTTPYAEGIAHMRLVDNDATPFPVEPGGNAASLHAQGTVTVVGTGEELDYQAIVFNVLLPGSTSFEDVHLLRTKIRLY